MIDSVCARSRLRRETDRGSQTDLHLPRVDPLFERRIARVNGHRLDEAKLSQVLGWCRANSIDCVYFLADSDDAQTSFLAEQNGFLHTDVRLTFEHTLTGSAPVPPPGDRVHLARDNIGSAKSDCSDWTSQYALLFRLPL